MLERMHTGNTRPVPDTAHILGQMQLLRISAQCGTTHDRELRGLQGRTFAAGAGFGSVKGNAVEEYEPRYTSKHTRTELFCIVFEHRTK